MKKIDWTKTLNITLIAILIIGIVTDLIAYYFVGLPIQFKNYILTEIIALILAIDNLGLYLKYKNLKK